MEMVSYYLKYFIKKTEVATKNDNYTYHEKPTALNK